jgi:hypothetical protein
VRVVVHQIDGVLDAAGAALAAGLLVASARLDPRSRRGDLRIETARRAPERRRRSSATVDVLALLDLRLERALLAGAGARGQGAPPGASSSRRPSVRGGPERAAEMLARHPWSRRAGPRRGEVTFRELLRALLDGAVPRRVPGLAVRGAGLLGRASG